MATAASQPSTGSAPASGAPAAPSTGVMLTEVPVSLKQLARLVVRGFYPVEEALIVDMLVRYPCVREEDLAGNFLFCSHNPDLGFVIRVTYSDSRFSSKKFPKCSQNHLENQCTINTSS